MSRRKGIKQVLAIVALCLAGSAGAQQQGPQPISPPQPTSSPGQIEVIEFFSFGCPHCYNLDPHLRKWEGSLKKDVAFKRVPVSFGRADWANLARVYTTLEAMKLAEKFSPLVFDAIQKDRVRLDDEKTRNDWLAKNSIDVKVFNDTWRSFGVDSMSKRYEQLAVSYKITGVPTLAVNGKFKVDGEGEETLKTTDVLIAKERTGK